MNSTRKFVLFFWIVTSLYGIYFSINYSSTPGESSKWSEPWPEQSQLKFEPDKFNFVVFLHPECDCSKATLNQIEEIVKDAGSEKIHYLAVFLLPEKMRIAWGESDLLKRTRGIKNLQIYIDDQKEFQRFGVKTSGQTLIFGPSKDLLFSGGLTVARGHIGVSMGQDFVLSLFKGRDLAKNKIDKKINLTPVFGCQTEEKN